jgi:hypothetical protein
MVHVKIAKLEALLARVQRHAAEPRIVPAAARAVVANAMEQVAEQVADVPRQIPDMYVARALSVSPRITSTVTSIPTSPPTSDAKVALHVEAQVAHETTHGLDVDLEPLPEPAVEVNRSKTETLAAKADKSDKGDESVERLIAAQPVSAPPEPEPEVEEPEPVTPPRAAQASSTQLAGTTDLMAASPVEEPERETEPDSEPAPASSRRPVASSPPLEEAVFGDEAPPPRHTPPPESGKLPAAPELEEYDHDVTGVREAKALGRPDETAKIAAIHPPDANLEATRSDAFGLPPPAYKVRESYPAREPQFAEPPTEPPPPPAELVAEATRAPLPRIAPVVRVISEVKPWKPETFGELLDATLSL